MPGKALFPQVSPSDRLLITLRTSDYNNDYFEDCYFTVDIFEDGYFNVDNAEDCYLIDDQGADDEDSDFTDDQGVNKTPGAYREASTTTLVIKDQLLPL